MDASMAIGMVTDAIKKVKPCYIKIEACPDCGPNQVQVERSFAYELYHQWSLLLEQSNNNEKLRLNGEITKRLDVCSKVYPDMVLHGGQDDLKHQILVCEIKRVDGSYPSSKDIINDLYKLSCFLHLSVPNNEGISNANYQHAVFIVANISCDKLKEKLKSALISDCEECKTVMENKGNITCISVEVINQETCVTPFKLEEC